jgi:DNA replication protein DnaC
MQKWMKRVAGAVRRRQRRRAAAASPVVAPPAPVVAILAGPLLSQKRRLEPEEEAALTRHLTALHLRHALSEHAQLTRVGAAVGFDHRHYLLRLAKCEIVARERRNAQRLIRAAHFPRLATDGGVIALPPLAMRLTQQLADGGWIAQGDNIIALGGSGTGKTRLLVTLGQAACRRGLSVRYVTAAALADELGAAFEERRLLALHRRLDSCRLLLIDDLGAAPLTPAGAALLFEVLSRRSERRSTVVASALPLLAWSRLFGTARLADAVVERLAYRVHRVDLGGVDPLAWATGSDAEQAVWRAEPVVAQGTPRGAGRRRTARLAPVRSA